MKALELVADKWIDVVALVVSLVALLASWCIPKTLDSDNNARQNRATCFSSVISARKALDTLNHGYTVAAASLDQHRANWESLRIELDNTKFGCHDALPGPDRDSLQGLIDDLAEAKAKSDMPYPDKAYLDTAEQWTNTALARLQVR